MKTIFSGLLGFLLVIFAVMPAERPQPPAFRLPPRGNDGPWNHRVLLASSKDGLAWAVGNEIIAEHASVPELFLGPDGRPILLLDRKSVV